MAALTSHKHGLEAMTSITGTSSRITRLTRAETRFSSRIALL
jgi:hypothetical protein